MTRLIIKITNGKKRLFRILPKGYILFIQTAELMQLNKNIT